MNRHSLFGRLSSKINGGAAAERAKAFRPQLEPLEVRRVLATVYVNDTWQEVGGDGTAQFGDFVVASSVSDPVTYAQGIVTRTYGVDAFGTISNAVAGHQTVAGYDKIQDAIDSLTGGGNTVSIIEGTYAESDIVIDKNDVLVKGTGRSGGLAGGDTVIVPEIASAKVEGEFPTGTHSGFILYGRNIELKNLRIDGSGGTVGPFNFHQGITTMYETQDGVNGVGGTDYAPTRGRPNLVTPRHTVVSVQRNIDSFAGPDNFDVNTSGNHGYVTGQAVSFWHYNAGSLPTNITQGTMYYVHVTDADQFTIHPTLTDATNDTNAIDVTGAVGGGTWFVQGAFDTNAVGNTGNVYQPAHGFASGDPAWFNSSSGNTSANPPQFGIYGGTPGGDVPGGIDYGTEYWVHVIDANNYTLHSSEADGLSGANPITFPNAGGGTIGVLTSDVYGQISNGFGGVRPQLQVHDVTVENVWYHGITMSGPAGMNFDANGDPIKADGTNLYASAKDSFDDGSTPDNEVFNSIVNNVGDAGNQGLSHIGILIQNVDGYETGDPGGIRRRLAAMPTRTPSPMPASAFRPTRTARVRGTTPPMRETIRTIRSIRSPTPNSRLITWSSFPVTPLSPTRRSSPTTAWGSAFIRSRPMVVSSATSSAAPSASMPTTPY